MSKRYYPFAILALFIRLEEFASPVDNIITLNEFIPNEMSKRMQIEKYNQNDPRFLTVCVIPKSVIHTRNSLNQADMLEATLRFSDIPIDARIIRSVNLHYYLGCLTSDNYAAVINNADIELATLIISEKNKRFVGCVDTWISSFDDGDCLINIKCRDYTSLLLDYEMPIDAYDKISLNAKLYDIISLIVNSSPGAGLKIELKSKTNPVLADLIPRIKKDKNGTARKSIERKMTYWDYIVHLCLSCGHICYIRNDTLYIDEYETDLSENLKKAPKVVYGYNISKLTFEKNLTGYKSPTIEVISYNPNNDTVMSARYPEVQNATTVMPSGQGVEDVRTITVKNIIDQNTLKRIARIYYYQIAKSEMVGSFSTKNLTIIQPDEEKKIDSDNIEEQDFFDILNLHAGDSIQIGIIKPFISIKNYEEGYMPSPDVIQLYDKTISEIQDYLVKIGYEQHVALQLATTIKSSHMPFIFYIKSFESKWDIENGWSGDFQICNYVIIRGQK